jgi:DUF971 family protein
MDSRPRIASTHPVGRYALGVDWSDGHDSIMPYRHLRAHCTCAACGDARAGASLEVDPEVQLESIELIGDASAFLRWSDGHETFFLLAELRRLCRCAYCIGEPERPITG